MDSKKINELLGIDDSYKAPQRIMDLIMQDDSRNKLVESFVNTGVDLSEDFFVNYFEEEHADRKVKKQDFTPLGISKILTLLVTGQSTYFESAVGTGSIMIQYWNLNNDSYFYLEELSDRALPFLLLNMLLRNISGFVSHGDSLTQDFKQIYKVSGRKIIIVDSFEQVKVSAIAMNPPYSAKWSGDKKLIEDERFGSYGVAPKSKADFAFLLNAFHKLEDNGTMSIVLPHGVLFRGGSEGKIREALLKENAIESVIGLPAKLFSATSIPTVILVLKKHRTKSDVLFIDASNDFVKGKNQNQLSQENIDKVLETNLNREDVDKYAYLATFDEIKENDFNLNIPRYVDTFEEEEPIDILEVSKEIQDIDAQLKEAEAELLAMLNDLTGDLEAIEATKRIFGGATNHE